MKNIVFIGASGHGKVCAEIARLNGYEEILFLDDDKKIEDCGGHAVVGVKADFIKFIDKKTQFFVSIGNAAIRKQIQGELIKAGGRIATLIHPNSAVSKDIKIGDGSIIMAGAVLNPEVVIGSGVIVNTSSSIDHDCVIGDYSHIAVGAHVCGTVRIGSNCWIGAGATISNNLSICNDCVIGAGALVIHDIVTSDTYIGVPVRQASERFKKRH